MSNIIGIALVILVFVTPLFAVEEAVLEVLEYQGSMMQVSGIWFLNTGTGMFGLELASLANAEGVAPELAAGDSVKLKGTMLNDVLQVTELCKAEIVYLPIVEEEKTSDYTGYQVNSKKCIGCNLCVKNCPVGAISMQKGKAVIDVTKCIQCGICANGSGKNWKGCPTGAIDKK
jgi:ferredoxin